jgi:hypothetical protein
MDNTKKEKEKYVYPHGKGEKSSTKKESPLGKEELKTQAYMHRMHVLSSCLR